MNASRLAAALRAAGRSAVTPGPCLRAVLVAILTASSAPAATWEGLDVVCDTEWPGCGQGGYFPLRISVTNRGQPRVLQFTFVSQYDRIPSLSKTVAVQTERLSFSLLIPCVSTGSYGVVRVAVDGRTVNELQHSVSFGSQFDSLGPAVLLVARTDADWTKYKKALESALGISTAASGGPSPYGGSVNVGDDHKYIVPEALPAEWQAYTGLDMVTIGAESLGKLPSEARTAILRWVETGGTLLVTEVGGDVDSLGDALDPVLASGDAPAPAGVWETFRGGGAAWAERERMMGLLVAVPKDPFRGFSSSQWESLLGGIGRERWDWTQRHGFSSRFPSPHFMEFLVPSVRGVPVLAFLVLITLFAIVIGPVNYLYLWKQRRLYLLVVTIPAIAIITSLSLFGYSIVAHGFATRARVRSLTYVDQASNTAVSGARVSLYSGLAPSSGLVFSRDTAVFPLWAMNAGFESGSVDWTENQHFESGWLRSRTRTQFFLTTHRKERGRLEVTPEPESLSVSNGFEWDLEALVVADAEGRLYHGAGIKAGAGARLTPLTSDDAAALIRRIGRDRLMAPAYAPSFSPGYSPYGYYRGGYSPAPASYSTNRFEHLIQQLSLTSNYEPSSDRTRWYAAVLAEEPGLDLGIAGANEEASLHILLGDY